MHRTWWLTLTNPQRTHSTEMTSTSSSNGGMSAAVVGADLHAGKESRFTKSTQASSCAPEGSNVKLSIAEHLDSLHSALKLPQARHKESSFQTANYIPNKRYTSIHSMVHSVTAATIPSAIASLLQRQGLGAAEHSAYQMQIHVRFHSHCHTFHFTGHGEKLT